MDTPSVVRTALAIVLHIILFSFGLSLLAAFCREQEKHLKTNFYFLLMVFWFLEIAFLVFDVLLIADIYLYIRYGTILGLLQVFFSCFKFLLIFFMAIDRFVMVCRHKMMGFSGIVAVLELLVVIAGSAASVYFYSKARFDYSMVGIIHIFSCLICLIISFTFCCCCCDGGLEHEVKVEKRLFWALFAYLFVQVAWVLANVAYLLLMTKMKSYNSETIYLVLMYGDVAVDYLSNFMFIFILVQVSSCFRRGYNKFWCCASYKK